MPTYYGDEMIMRPVTLTMMIQVVKLHTCIQYILIPAEWNLEYLLTSLQKKKQIQCLSQWSRNENVRMPITIAQSPVIIRRLSCNAAFTKKQNLILVCFWQVYFCFLGPQQKLMAQTKPPRKSCKTSDLHRTAEIAIHTCIYVYVFTK